MFVFAIRHAIAIQNHEKSIQLIGSVVEEMWEKGHHVAILNYGSYIARRVDKEKCKLLFILCMGSDHLRAGSERSNLFK